MFPTSPETAAQICNLLNWDGELYVEFGPGEGGNLTKEILSRMRKKARLVLFETNPEFLEALQRIDDERVTVIPASAEYASQILNAEGLSDAEAIITGVPFSLMEKERQQSIMQGAHSILRDGGKFAAYQISDSVREAMQIVFGEVDEFKTKDHFHAMKIFLSQKHASSNRIA